MEQEPEVKKISAKQERARKAVKEIRQATRRKFSSEEKIGIGQSPISRATQANGIDHRE